MIVAQEMAQNPSNINTMDEKEQSKSWLFWKEKIKNHSRSIKDFQKQVHKFCTPKQIEVISILLREKISPNEIAKRLHKKGQTVTGLLNDAFDRIERHR